ncbi:MAG: LysM peptidoglycan-binding domain-containing protein [Actinophytocola sp.]|nr:LysM peptidoglycan-binding domain-containing protein [Actinophytocola sp.]
MSYRGKHRKMSSATRNIARVAIAGVAVGAPIAMAAPAQAAYSPNWDMLAQCESGGNWSINTGNGYYGGVQFSHSTWQAYGGSGYAHQASKGEQVRIAEKVLASQGPNAWPACTQKTGWHVAGGSGSYQGSNTEGGASAEQAPAPKAAPKAAPVKARVAKSNPEGDYTVKKGQTLSEIAKKEDVKGGWTKLHKLNKSYISDADFILVGQKIATK